MSSDTPSRSARASASGATALGEPLVGICPGGDSGKQGARSFTRPFDGFDFSGRQVVRQSGAVAARLVVETFGFRRPGR